jgi:hypothetical protein
MPPPAPYLSVSLWPTDSPPILYSQSILEAPPDGTTLSRRVGHCLLMSECSFISSYGSRNAPLLGPIGANFFH